MDAFEGENMQTQYRVLNYKIDLYFLDYKLAIEVDEKGHDYRRIDYEIKRQKAIEKEVSCEFIRINPDEKFFNVFKVKNEIYRHTIKSIKKLTEKSTKEYLIDKLSKRLLGLEFKKNNSIKSKALKHIVKNILLTL